MENWYYVLLGEEFGPYSKLELCAVFQKRNIGWDTVVRSDDVFPIPASEVGWLTATVKLANQKGEDLERKVYEAKAKLKAHEEKKVRAEETSERKLASRPKVENFEKVSLQTEVLRKSPYVNVLSVFLSLIITFSVVIPTLIAVFNERKWGEDVINIVGTALPTVGSISILLYLTSVLHDIRYFLAEQTAELKSTQKK
ncbi:DUF4339 domain-containing protein [Rubripirellula sp.]|nr:hypothetical protein [Rubripirellula sp.]MDB4621910.1 DUF4339 domain-containing protein [Rubripirellula sp.]